MLAAEDVKVVYIAGRFSQRQELLSWAGKLADIGVDCTSSWLTIPEGVKSCPDDPRVAAASLLEIYPEIMRADTFILDDSREGGEGKYAELGYAQRAKKNIILLGPIRTIFSYNNDVMIPNWVGLVEWLNSIPRWVCGTCDQTVHLSETSHQGPYARNHRVVSGVGLCGPVEATCVKNRPRGC